VYLKNTTDPITQNKITKLMQEEQNRIENICKLITDVEDGEIVEKSHLTLHRSIQKSQRQPRFNNYQHFSMENF
jgi:hypothetical protein